MRWPIIACLIAGCSSDGDAAECPSIAGHYEFTENSSISCLDAFGCDVVQNGCSATWACTPKDPGTSGTTTLTGTVAVDGKLTVAGTLAGKQVSCSGKRNTSGGIYLGCDWKGCCTCSYGGAKR